MLPSLIWKNQDPSAVASAIRTAHINSSSCVFLSEILGEDVVTPTGSTIQEASVASFKCGADILVFKDNAAAGIESIVNALEKGDITWKDIETLNDEQGRPKVEVLFVKSSKIESIDVLEKSESAEILTPATFEGLVVNVDIKFVNL